MAKTHLIKNGIKNILMITLISILLVSLIAAVNFEQVYNPFTYKLDYYRSSNMSGENLTIDWIFMEGNLMPLTRDIYDIWFLLQRTSQFDFSFEKTRKIFKYKYGVVLDLRTLEDCMRKPAFAKNWQARLSKQISQLPDIELVISDIVNRLKVCNELIKN